MTNANGKKTCTVCTKPKVRAEFYRSNSSVHESDGIYPICKECIRKTVDLNDINEFVGFLKDIDRPFIDTMYQSIKDLKAPTIGRYLQKIAVLRQYKDLKFFDSQGIDLPELKEIATEAPVINEPHSYDSRGNLIILTKEILAKWEFTEFTEDEMLYGEKYISDMKEDFAIETLQEEGILMELAQLAIIKQKLINGQQWADYEKVNRQSTAIMKDSGLRVVDRKDNLQKSGIDSIGEIILQLERDSGFIPPNQVEFEPDDIDYMLMFYMQWVQKNFGNEEVMTEVNQSWREEVEMGASVVEIDSSANQNYDEDEESEKQAKKEQEVVIVDDIEKLNSELVDEFDKMFL